MKKFFFLFISLFLLGLTIFSSKIFQFKAENENQNFNLITSVTYLCKDNKTLEASFYKGEPQSVKPGEMPIPNGKVKIFLSDGRKIELNQTVSADGSRYANQDESFIFWSKGNGVLVLENNNERNYKGCIVLAEDPGNLANYYLNDEIGFTVRYPKDWKLDDSYQYQALGPNKIINGVKFTIPSNFAKNTNLSGFDTGISIEYLPGVSECKASLFLEGSTNEKLLNDNGIDYSFASVNQGAAGNYYEEQVWAILGTNPCLAIRYFIHSTNIENYPEKTVSEFDRVSLVNYFDEIRHSLILR
ncbi:MAG: MliC family protein [Minisyncoccia bacterium]